MALTVERFRTNPIIRPHMDARMGDNINGPSLVRAPSWVKEPLGRYYLYFGHHRGTYIRLAYADRLEGPWRTYEPGALDLADSLFVKHVASPDVHVDEDRREVRMYYHGPLADGPGQASRVAVSGDGLHFVAQPEVLGAPYLRVFRWDGWHYGIGMPGVFSRSRDGLSGFERGPNPFPPGQRHAAVTLDGDTLSVCYSNRGDCPERIFRSTIDLTPDWTQWNPSLPTLVLEPELDYEGVNCPRVPSRGGPIKVPAYQLRDPFVFREDGRDYLLYAVAGERGLAIAELKAG